MTTATAVPPKTRSKALAVLREARLTIRNCWPSENGPAVFVDAHVAGHEGTYDVTLRDGLWVCSRCGQSRNPGGCGHALAVQLVTGWAPDPQSATSGECRHGMTPEWCADCTGRDGGEAELSAEYAALLQQRGWTAAIYDGKCAYCGEPFAKGTPIRVTPATVLGWAGPCCGARDA